MRYIVRAIKYFFYLIIILALIMAILVMAGFVEGNINKMFVHGYDSVWQICLIMAVFAAIYPKFGFSSRTAHLYGSMEEVRPKMLEVMERLGYKLEKESAESFSFVKRSLVSRVFKMWEDRIVISSGVGGLNVEGLTKDIVRVISGLEAGTQDV